MNFVVTSIIIISSCILNVPGVSSGRIFFFFPLFFQIPFQEQGNEKTNNGTHYKLQLLYSNGESLPWPLLGAGISRIFQNSLAWIPFSAGMGPGARMGLGNRTQQKPSMGLLCCSLGWMPGFFVISVFFCYLCNFCYLSMLSLAAGVRTEQDLYVRLIDSVTKQVSRAVLSHPILPAQHFLGVSPSLLHLPLLLCSIADLFWRVIKNCALNYLFSPLWSAGFHPLCNNIYVIFMALFPCT